MIDYKDIITIEPGKWGGKPTIRGMKITVGDILSWLASGMTIDDILYEFHELTKTDVYAALSYAADRENGNFAPAPVTEYSALIPEEYILKAKDEDLQRAVTGEELLERLLPRVEKLFDK